jgi:iron-sulfur cluster repair protein YtfE (RIC family)
MRIPLLVSVPIALIGAIANSAVPQGDKERHMATTVLRIPASIRSEHKEIHAALVEATKAPGRVGAAAKELATVLDPHFVREEEIALPPLGLLAPLSSGASLSEGQRSEAVKMTDALSRELPRMLGEHKQIKTAVEKLGTAARAEGADKYERLAHDLALHAQTEEEVLYPAAMVVGELIRLRESRKR